MTVSQLITAIEEVGKNTELQKFLVVHEGITYLNQTTDNFRNSASNEATQLVNKLLCLCDEVLITCTGQHNYANRRLVEQAGYRFEKGEEDSFGPLTSMLVLKGFKVVYG
jgi:hypothetical protein